MQRLGLITLVSLGVLFTTACVAEEAAESENIITATSTLKEATEVTQDEDIDITATPTLEVVTETPQEAAIAAFHLPGSTEEIGWLGHNHGKVEALAFSPDGRILATAHNNGDVILWDMASGEELHLLSHPQSEGGGLAALAYSPDGSLLAATEGYIGQVVLWEVSSGEKVRTLDAEGNIGNVLSEVVFSPDGSLMAAAKSSGQSLEPAGRTFVWQTTDWQQLYVLEDAAPSVAFSPNGEQLFTLSGVDFVAWIPEGELAPIVQWSMKDGTRTSEIPVDGFIIGLALSPDGTMLAANVAQMGKTAFTLLIDTANNEIMYTLPMPEDAHGPSWLDFSPDGSLLAVGYQPNKVIAWDTTTGKSVRDIQGPADGLGDPIFSPDGKLLAADSSDERILFWEMPSESALEPAIQPIVPTGIAAMSTSDLSSLPDLLAIGLVTVDSITVKVFPEGWTIDWILTNPGSSEQRVVIPCSLLLLPTEAGPPRLIVTKHYETTLLAKTSAQVTPFIISYDPELGVPPQGTTYTVGSMADDWQNQCAP